MPVNSGVTEQGLDWSSPNANQIAGAATTEGCFLPHRHHCLRFISSYSRKFVIFHLLIGFMFAELFN